MSDLYYDPWDVEIDIDPYPTYRRLRDESPLYYNDRHGFWGLSRYADVDAALRDPQRLSSAKGDILEVVKADPVMPPGVFINEDPPLHTIHRALVSRAFMPKKMRELEGRVRAFCATCLDPLVGGERFDFVQDLGAELPMRTIGMLVGIPDADQPTVRAQAHAVLRNKPGEPLPVKKDRYFDGDLFTDYVAWRKKNPSDDLISELLAVEFEDESGTMRNLTTEELLIFLAVIAGAGVETTGRLFGWMGKVLAEHPDQRQEILEDRSLIPTAVEELLRFEPPGPHVARYVTEDIEFSRSHDPCGKRAPAHAGLSEPRRAPLRRTRSLQHPPQTRRAPDVRTRCTLLPRRSPCPSRGTYRARRGAQPIPEMGHRHRRMPPLADLDSARLGCDACHRQLKAVLMQRKRAAFLRPSLWSCRESNPLRILR